MDGTGASTQGHDAEIAPVVGTATSVSGAVEGRAFAVDADAEVL